MIWKDEQKLRETCKECGWSIINWGIKKNHRKKEYNWFSLAPSISNECKKDIETLYNIFLTKMGSRADKCNLFCVRARYAPEQKNPAISISVG